MRTPAASPAGGRARPAWGPLAVRGAALAYLSVLLLVPLVVIARDGLREGAAGLVRAAWQPAAAHALGLTLWTALATAGINAVLGTLTAFVLVRYRFPGRGLLNAVVDLPLAIPTLVAGVMLVVLYGPQSAVGGWLERTFGWRLLYAPPGIILALLYLTYPLIVRAVQPVLEGLDPAQEEAAATLGAGGWTTIWRVIFPPLVRPLATGVLLSVARAIGEFGAVVIVAGNIPLFSQTAAVYVFGEVESENRLGASAVSLVMLALAFALVLVVDALQRGGRRPAAPEEAGHT